MTGPPQASPASKLRTVLKWVAIVGGALFGLLILFVLVSYAAADKPEPVAKTVMDDPDLPFLDVNGVRLHLQTFGDSANPVVIALHGGPGDDHRMLLQLQALSDEYFVVFYDQRGSGLSQRVPSEDLTYEGMLSELGGIIDHFSPEEPVRLIGHSWGAMLSAGYMGRHPERVLQAVLAEPGFLTPAAGDAFLEVTGGMPDLSLEILWALWGIFMESRKIDGPDDDARIDYMMLEFVMTDIEDHPLAGYFCGGRPDPATMQHFRFGTRANLIGQANMMGDDGKLMVPFGDGVGDYPNKVLFMTGSCNTYIGAEHQQEFHLSLFKETELVVIENAGHLMFGDQPEDSIGLVRSYFAEATEEQTP